jgi:hypothetical protein
MSVRNGCVNARSGGIALHKPAPRRRYYRFAKQSADGLVEKGSSPPA